MKKVIAYIALSLGVLIVSGYVVFSMLEFSVNEKDVKCRNLEVTIEGKVHLLTEDEIGKILVDAGLHPIGASLNNLRTEKIESILKDNPLVRTAVCYHTPDGNVRLDVRLKEPRFLIAGTEKYYVDDERNIIPVPLTAMAYVPLVTGRVTKSMATGKLYDFVDYVSKDPFWNAQISQIYVRNDMKVELIPRVGDAVILLGTLDAYREKLDRVYRLYDRGFNEIGWNMYESLDLQYDNQVVAVKKKNYNHTLKGE